MGTLSLPAGHSETKDLVRRSAADPYLLVEHTLSPGHTSRFRSHAADHRTFIVIDGNVTLQYLRADTTLGSKTFDYLVGWHVLPGSVYRIMNDGSKPTSVIEAGSTVGETREAIEPTVLASDGAPGACPDVSLYKVSKPWGHEIWYTDNLENSPYALKQIHMTAGHQSSLQSHEYKRETNYVIAGEATVLDGALAPEDPQASVDITKLVTTVHPPRSGWSSVRRELHRVIARTTYTSIEVSTPELDDVVRWQDDTGRSNGRISSEHSRSQS